MSSDVSFYDLVGFCEAQSDARRGAPPAPDLETAALFLDFDGTLVEIAERPDAIVLPEGLERLLQNLWEGTGGASAIVSGRSLRDLEKRIPGYSGVLVGSHGAEWRIGHEYSLTEEAESDAFATVSGMISLWVEKQEGVLLEMKPASLVLHYRQDASKEDRCVRILTALCKEVPGFTVRASKMAVELMPECVGKKRAVLRLLEEWPERIPIAVGDDTTDESMFEAAKARGGYGIRVGEGKTCAGYRLSDVAEVHELLESWTG